MVWIWFDLQGQMHMMKLIQFCPLPFHTWTWLFSPMFPPCAYTQLQESKIQTCKITTLTSFSLSAEIKNTHIEDILHLCRILHCQAWRGITSGWLTTSSFPFLILHKCHVSNGPKCILQGPFCLQCICHDGDSSGPSHCSKWCLQYGCLGNNWWGAWDFKARSR